MSATEKDFQAVATAALDYFARGDKEQAFILDDLARKMNRELTGKATLQWRKHTAGKESKSWDVESPLEAAGLRRKESR